MRMTTALTSEKKQNIKGKVEELTKNSTIREASSLGRSIVASLKQCQIEGWIIDTSSLIICLL